MKEVVEISSYGGYKLFISSEWIEVVAPGNLDSAKFKTMNQARRWIKSHRRRANR